MTTMKKQLSLALGAIVVVVVIVFLVPGTRNALTTFYTYLFAPQAVKDMLFVVGTEEEASLAQVRFGALRFTSFDNLSIVEVARREKQIYTLLKDRATGEVDVYALEDSHPRALTRDGTMKEGLSISPNGALLSYATVGEALDGRDPIYYDVRRHSVTVLNIETGELSEFGNGAHPYFLDDDTLFYTDTEGYVVRSVTGPEESTLRDSFTNTIVAPPAVSPESGYFAFRNVLSVNDFTVLHLDSLFPVSVRLEKVIAPASGTLQDLAFRGDVAYLSISEEAGAVRIFEEPLGSDEPTQALFTFPREVQIMSIEF